MRTDSWFRERQERAERMLRERGPSLGALLDAFQQVTDDPVSEGATRIVGQALGILPVEEFLHVLHQAREAVIQAADEAAAATSRAVTVATAEARAKGERLAAVHVSDVRARPGEYCRGMLIELAAALQALTWAVSPPGERHGPISY